MHAGRARATEALWVIDGDLCNERKKPLKPNNMDRIEILSRVHSIKGRTIIQSIQLTGHPPIGAVDTITHRQIFLLGDFRVVGGGGGGDNNNDEEGDNESVVVGIKSTVTGAGLFASPTRLPPP